MVHSDSKETRSAEDLGELIKALEEAVGQVGHEIKNPLAIIYGNAQYMLACADSLDADLRETVEDIEEASHRLDTSLKKLTELVNALDPEENLDNVLAHLRQLKEA